MWIQNCKVYFGLFSSHLLFLDGYFRALNTTTVTVVFISYQRRRTCLPIQNLEPKRVSMWVYIMNTYHHKGLYLQKEFQTPVFVLQKPRQISYMAFGKSHLITQILDLLTKYKTRICFVGKNVKQKANLCHFLEIRI